MRNSIFTIAYLLSIFSLHAVELKYSTVNYPEEDFVKAEFDGVKFYVHKKAVKKSGRDLSNVLDHYRFFVNKISLLTPETIEVFKEKEYKFILLSENCDGFEIIRSGQSKWDSRHGKLAEKSLIVCKSVLYVEESKTDRYALFPYLVHEIMHIHHNEILGFASNWELRKSFNLAKRNPVYKNDDYIFHTFFEYWAEISTAYLLDDGYDPDTVRPPNSKWLYENDRLSYDLCVKLLGADKAGYKPRKTETTELVEKPNDLNVNLVVVKNPKFSELYYNLTTKADEANLEEFRYKSGLGGSMEKALNLYSEAYNIGTYIFKTYPNKNSERIEKIVSISSSKLNLKP